MKKLLLLPLLMITSFCFAQDAKKIIGKPIKIVNFLVAQNDFPKFMYWDDAKTECAKLGAGWRLPTNDELNILYQNKDKIGGFRDNFYWSSTVNEHNLAWLQFFFNGSVLYYNKNYNSYARAVRTI
jgi:hypothetical protein